MIKGGKEREREWGGFMCGAWTVTSQLGSATVVVTYM